jgi:ATP-binding cassette subfamily C protein
MSWRVFFSVALMVLVGFTEGIGLLLLFPLLQVVGLNLEGGSIGKVAEFVSSLFSAVNLHPTLVAVLGVYVLIYTINSLLCRWQTTVTLSLNCAFEAHLRKKLYHAISNVNWLFFARTRSSTFTHALTNEIDRVSMATYYLLSLISGGIITLVYLLLALRLSGAMTGLVFLCGLLLLIFLRRKTVSAHQIGEGFSQATEGLYAVTIEHLSSMKTAKSYGTQERNVDDFSKQSDRVVQAYMASDRNRADVLFWFQVGSVLILSLVLIFLTAVLKIPTAGVLLLLFLFYRIIPRFSNLQQNYQQFLNLLPAFANVMKMQKDCEVAVEPKPVKKGAVIEFKNQIKFEKLSFAYEEKSYPLVLSDLNLTIQANEMIAIVGSTGAGKSTIADLIMGLILPKEGKIFVDEIPLNAEYIHLWRQQIGYVTQDTFLFHDTVRANLRWACPDATDEEIGEALRLAAAEDFVSKLPEGMDTVLRDRGVRLSGGERQRLSLARALLRKPSLLILDEATSNLDSENEQRILAALQGLRGQMTILMITHRLSAIRYADVIHVVDEGRLVDSGSWNELLSRDQGRFYDLFKAQSVDGKIEEGVNIRDVENLDKESLSVNQN